MADDTNRKILEEVRKMPDEELAACQADIVPTNLRAMLAKQEQERRARVHQHELDRQLMFEQVRWMKFTAIRSLLPYLDP